MEVDELNPALLDIEEIVVSRPELTPEGWDAVTKATDWIKATLRPEVRGELEIEYTKRQSEFEDVLRKETQEQVRLSMEEWRTEQKPLDKDELSTLLSQDYLEFPLQIKERGKVERRSFTISELPATSESRFVASMHKHLTPLMEKLNSSEWNWTGTVVEQIHQILATVPSALEVAGELVAICLDPWEEDTTINGRWVLDNISIPRISYIIDAQSEVNRYRDFFLNGSRLFRSLKTK